MARKRKQKKEIEQYSYEDHERLNNPPAGLVSSKNDSDTGKQEYAYDPHIDPSLEFDSQRSEIEDLIDQGLSADDLESARASLQELKKRQDAYLNWAGKAERTSFEVPTTSLHVHERIDPRTIIEAVRARNGHGQQQSLFEFGEENPPLREAVEFYKHKHNWSNRLIAGDSLQVMNSLVQKEAMAGKVQMIYVDPPYGIRYSSNFQPFVDQKNVRDASDEDLTREPEMIKAFRDTWKLGIHSYLTYLRDRIRLSYELLADTGAVFVQISQDNVHHLREILDEIFGPENFIAQITFRKKKMPFGAKHLERMSDYLLFYAKDKNKLKYRQLYYEKNVEGDSKWCFVELPDGTRRRMTKEEHNNHSLLPKGAVPYMRKVLRPAGYNKSGIFPITLNGKEIWPKEGTSWNISQEGAKRLLDDNRLELSEDGKTVNQVLKLTDYPVSPITSLWGDTSGEQRKVFVVQTSHKVVERCMLMVTDPGDLVLDPTCGSGTTAYVAERWGRRWITCDTSRIAVSLTRQRLMTASYDFYQLARPEEGVESGFNYKTVPHITLGSIANNETPEEETLYDQPVIDSSKARVTGPFTVEAVPSPVVKPLDEVSTPPGNDESVSREGATVRQEDWCDELLKAGIRGKAGQTIHFSRVEPLAGTRWLHADAETKEDKPRRVVISFGPEDAPLEPRQVELALEEAQKLVPKPAMVVFAAFQFDPEAAKDIDETNWPDVTLLKTQMNTDLLTEDLKKKRASNESFWLIGQPDIQVQRIDDGEHAGKYQVEVLGFDYFDMQDGTIRSGDDRNIAMWMLDPDYDGRSLFPRQVFFPMAGKQDGWYRLAKDLKAEIDEDLIEAYWGTKSIPFKPGDHERIAVKIVDDRGIESLKIVEVE